MKHRLIALGILSPLLLMVICVAAFLLVGGSVATWLFFSLGGESSQAIRIIPVGPLATPEAGLSSATAQDADQPIAPPVAEVTPEVVAEIDPQPTAVPLLPEASPTEEIEESQELALPPGSVNSTTQEGAATRLVIPKLNLDAPVVISPIENQTWKVDHLGQAVGHLEGTASPGSNSNIVLAGHVTLSADVYGPFAGLAQLTPGDTVIVYSGEQKFEYVVDDYQTVERTSIEVTYPSETGQITLITCTNWNTTEDRYEQRLVVKGRLTMSN